MNGLLAAHVIVLVCMGGSAPPNPPERSGPRVCAVMDDVISDSVATRTKDALAYLASHKLAPVGRAPIVAIGALNGAHASDRAVAVLDASAHGLGAQWAGHPALLLEPFGAKTTSTDPEAILHELVHIWLRTRGAPQPSWSTRTEPDEQGVVIATHESAVVEEALADFIAATRSRSPVLYRASARPHTPPRSVRGRGARCPEAFSGRPHADARVLSGALWDVGVKHKPEAFDVLLSALANTAPSNTQSIRTLVQALAKDLQRRAPKIAQVWTDVVHARGLLRCHDPIHIVMQRNVQSPFAQPVIPPMRGDVSTASLQRYEVNVDAVKSFSVGVRFAGVRAPGLYGVFKNARGRTIATTSLSLKTQTNSLASAVLTSPPKATRFLFRFTNPEHTPIAFDDIKVIPLH